MKVKCIIVDDEPNAQAILKLHCDKIDFLSVEIIFSNAIEAASYLKSNTIDLIFLDIEMPQVTGLIFLRMIDSDAKVIFTTAYSEYALEGYEFNVVDYLLKPITFERFSKAVKKISVKNEVKEPTDLIKLSQLHQSIKPSEIIYLESIGNYVKIYFSKSKTEIIHSTLKDLYEILLVYNFIRCHKSFVVNQKFIEEVYPNFIKTTSNKEIPLGISYRQQVRERMKEK